LLTLHALIVPPGGAPNISTAAQLPSSSSATYSSPSGPNAKSMIEVKPPSKTFTQSGLAPHCAAFAHGDTRQIFDSPAGAGNPLSSPT